jgi:hypothetical protein
MKKKNFGRRTKGAYKSMRRILWVLVALPLLGGLGYLFRWETYDNPEFGLIKTYYRWGRPTVQTLDRNRDGRIDGQYWIDAPFGTVAIHFGTVLKMTEDRDSDGRHELRVFFRDNEIDRLELDEDGDGKYERILEGAAARRYYASLQGAGPVQAPE